MLRKKRNEKTRFAQTVFRSNRFFLALLGANQRGPVEPMFDRFAMGTTSVRMRASGHSLTINFGEGLGPVREVRKSGFIEPDQSAEF